VIVNSVQLGGHAVLEQGAFIGGLCGIHQFCRIGRYSMVGGMSRVNQDVPPFAMCAGNPAKIVGINTVALERAGFARDRMRDIRKAYHALFFSKAVFRQALEKLEHDPVSKKSPDVKVLLDFIRASKRGVMTRSDAVDPEMLRGK